MSVTVVDTTYIHLDEKKIAIGFIVPSKSVNFNVSAAQSDQELNYKPNGTGSLGFLFEYKKYQVKLTLRTNNFNHDPTRYGKTQSFDLRLGHFGQRWIFDAHYLNYKGFYVANPRDFIPTWNLKGPMPLSTTLQASSIGLSAYKIRNNNKFSFKAAFAQNEMQLKSAGSFLFGYFFQLSGIHHSQSMVPDILKTSVDSALQLKSVSFINGGLSLGYAHNFIFLQHFFISFAVLPGIGVQLTNLDRVYKTDSYSSLGLTLRLFSDAGFGYKGGNFFVGVNARSESLSYAGKKQLLEFEISQASVYLGRKFDAANVFQTLKKWKNIL